jgi:tetratricopeptide (TPR) repeat protein
LDRLAYSAPHTASASLSSRQLAEILDVPGSRVRAWVRSGLLQPVESLEGASGFDFGQVCWAKSLRDFGGAGISCRRIRRSLDQLKSWLPNLESALGPSAVLERDGHLLVRLEDGQLADATGQGLFDFVAKPSSASLSVQGRQRSAAEWFQEGCAKEAAEDWPAAAQAYQQAIGAGGPDATTSFNLGNVLYRMEAPEAAVQRFQEAIGLDPALVEAWNNLGNVLAELGRPEEAVAALQRALMLRPDFVDARYNLADVLDQLGRYPEAMAYWKQYVAQDPTSPWGRHARKRLAALKS